MREKEVRMAKLTPLKAVRKFGLLLRSDNRSQTVYGEKLCAIPISDGTSAARQ